MRTPACGFRLFLVASACGAADDFTFEQGFALLLNGKDLTG